MIKEAPGRSEQFYNHFRNYRGLLHVLFWGIAAWAFYYLYTAKSTSSTNIHPIAYLQFFYILRLGIGFGLSYSFLYFIMPLGKQKKIFWISLLVLLSCWYTIFIILLKIETNHFPQLSLRPENTWLHLILGQFYYFFFLFGFFIAFCYFVDINDRQKELQNLEKFKTEKIRLESTFLKSQVNPHFLFNTLNNIYALSLKKSEQTAVIIERLESLLHYMLYECKEDQVPLENEFLFTNSYIELEKLRHRSDRCQVTVNVQGNPTQKKIAPLLLINFLENAFKHGTKTSFGKSWIDLDIKVEAKSMKFILRNSKPTQPAFLQGISEYKGGIGLKNVKRRLEILYPKKHELIVTDGENDFEIQLSLIF